LPKARPFTCGTAYEVCPDELATSRSQWRGALKSTYASGGEFAAFLPQKIEHLRSTTHPYGATPLCELHVEHAAAARSAIATIRHSIPNDPFRRRQRSAAPRQCGPRLPDIRARRLTKFQEMTVTSI
jgi:hypothetical protein